MDWEHLYFRYWTPSVNFCQDNVSVGAPVKVTTLTLATQTLAICKSETCSVDDFLYSAAHHMSNFITQSICL